MSERFSDRHGYRGSEQEITVSEDAPVDLRFAIPLTAQDSVGGWGSVLDLAPAGCRLRYKVKN